MEPIVVLITIQAKPFVPCKADPVGGGYLPPPAAFGSLLSGLLLR
jgi:hypothetical protein